MLTALDAVPRPITPGAEMAALLRFHCDITWTGSISAGGMGPGTPAMTAEGSGTHTTIQDGRWVVGDYRQEHYLLDGTHVLTWQLHWVAGWDPALGEYRATVADCYGHAEVLRGRIDADRLVFESTGDPPVRIRLTWDASDPATIVWRNETSTAGGPWSLIEEYRCTPLPPPEPVAHGGRSAFTEAIRPFNKRPLNPLMLHLAGRRHWYAARLQHVGRRSGRSYATPSSRDRCPAASPSRSPTGETSTGTATWRPPATGVLAVHGTRYTITAPRTVLSAEVTGTLPPYWRRMLHGVAEYLVVRAEPADVHPVLPAGTGRSG